MRATAILPHDGPVTYRNEPPENPPAWSVLEPAPGVTNPGYYLGRWIDGVFHTAAIFPAGTTFNATGELLQRIVGYLNADARNHGVVRWPRS